MSNKDCTQKKCPMPAMQIVNAWMFLASLRMHRTHGTQATATNVEAARSKRRIARTGRLPGRSAQIRRTHDATESRSCREKLFHGSEEARAKKSPGFRRGSNRDNMNAPDLIVGSSRYTGISPHTSVRLRVWQASVAVVPVTRGQKQRHAPWFPPRQTEVYTVRIKRKLSSVAETDAPGIFMKKKAVSGTETRGTANRIARPDRIRVAVVWNQPVGQSICSAVSATIAPHLENFLRGTRVPLAGSADRSILAPLTSQDPVSSATP